ncbi:nucleoside deaminase [Marinovum sp. 2_MG-2023]|uniref:nucleoside deaminase n=1 Tax=Roseobacteraceae TaxID=2854170 RepID=UPI001FD04281|nr:MULTISPECIES: nucleoside deaminase [Roseobacteraceae]MCJ7871321.1 nucleoside deaminase [Phaeobacter sp. J2-8]MDO6731463.1 nucleoside deaminase [Marinovum sp. 2_MG-2023]MDO6780823.1 nucleoside deaminase [Marinovum sp. 1_MG-2023]
MYNETFMRRAIEISAEALNTPGTEPFGAVIVKDGKIVGEGINQSLINHDPTSHGETEAIRDACRNLETVDLRGCELYSSCEPCALCVAAMNIAGIAALYYAADMDQAGAAIGDLPEAARFPVDVDRLIHECGHGVHARKMPAEQHMASEATTILTDWATLAKSRV